MRTIHRAFHRLLPLLAICVPAAADESTPSANPVHFATSCSAGIQAEFDHSVALLHSFEYPSTTQLFAELIEREPGCAMAYWGAAMSLWHPLWQAPPPADLEHGAALLAKARPLAQTDRERAYIDALGAFFADTTAATHPARVRAYADAMAKVYGEYYRDDPESAVFYALAQLASADPRDKTYANQFRAAGLANWVRESRPTHPGVLHYTIHAYDYPGLAHLALSAATAYADAAPDSAHAQHMPSHIFTRLGLWERAIHSNHDSMHSAAEYTERAGLQGQYDEGLHSLDYLMYALLQTARDGEAANLLDRLGAIDRTNTDNFKVAYTYAAAPARYALERRAWQDAAGLELGRAGFPWQQFPFARSIHHFAKGIGAARSGRTDLASEEIAAIRDIQANQGESTPPYWRAQDQVHVDAIRAWVLYAEGRKDEALASARAAADLEDSVDKHPVTPGEILPARELLGDLLTEAGQYAQALTEYETVLRHSPNRLNAMRGAADAAERAGRSDLAPEYRQRIRQQVANGSGTRAAALKAG